MSQDRRFYCKARQAKMKKARPNAVNINQSELAKIAVRSRQEVAKILGLTVPGVRQIENRALAKVCRALRQLEIV